MVILPSRLNERILKVDKNAWLNLIGTIPEDTDYTKWSSQNLSTYLMKKMHYFFVPRRNMRHLYSFWVVADLKSPSGRQLLREALEYIVCNLELNFICIIVTMYKIYTFFYRNQILMHELVLLLMQKMT